MAVNKSTLRALVVLELINSDEEKEEESNGRGKTRNWIKKREELRYYPNIVHKLQMGDTDVFKEIIRMDFEHFKEILNLIEPDIFPQEVVSGNKVVLAADRLTLRIRFLATSESFGSLSYT